MREYHGGCGTPEYNVFKSARQRCQNPNNRAYADYGGRGIEFRFTGFGQFIGELGPRTTGMTLERIKNSGHYEPGNVKWASRKEQSLNRRPRKASHISFVLTRNKWRVRIWENNKLKHIGMYNTRADAEKALKSHGSQQHQATN